MIEAGNIFINDKAGSDPGVPNGGVKDSGYGRECYSDGLFSVSNKKTIIFGKWIFIWETISDSNFLFH